MLKLGGDGREFWLAGLGDQLAHPLGHGRFRGVDDLPGTLAQVRSADPVLLLVHEPDIFPRVPDRVALTLAGHTTAGNSVRRLSGRRLFLQSSASASPTAKWSRDIIVSGGLGTSIIPARLGVPPEILRIELGA